jgi:hypothetical protein
MKICFLGYFEENPYIDQKVYIILRINSMEKLQRKYLVEKFNSVHNSFTATHTDSHRAWLSFSTALHTQKYWLDFPQLKLEA